MNENELVQRIRRLAAPQRTNRLVRGIGDDCAILQSPSPKHELLITTDLLIENVHFRRTSHPATAVGHKALARGLSDLAAMGGSPRGCLVSLILPPDIPRRWVESFYKGLLQLARLADAPLIGGDLASGASITCDIVVVGEVPKGQSLRRDGARPGDQIFVSGALGASALGLLVRKGPAWRRHLRPEPRLELGRFLRERVGATSAMDLSDGLSLDLARLCTESGVAASLDSVPPIWPGATLEQALHGGEDYELLFTVPPEVRVPARHRRLRLTRIGEIVRGKSGAVMLQGNPLPARGYDHFRKT